MVKKRTSDFIDQVEMIARMMCEEMDIDPDEMVDTTYGEVRLPNEPANQGPTLIVAARRWHTFRREAAMHLAGFRAVNRFFLTEA